MQAPWNNASCQSKPCGDGSNGSLFYLHGGVDVYHHKKEGEEHLNQNGIAGSELPCHFCDTMVYDSCCCIGGVLVGLKE